MVQLSAMPPFGQKYEALTITLRFLPLLDPSGPRESQKVVQKYVFLGQKSIESSRNYRNISRLLGRFRSAFCFLLLNGFLCNVCTRAYLPRQSRKVSQRSIPKRTNSFEQIQLKWIPKHSPQPRTSFDRAQHSRLPR